MVTTDVRRNTTGCTVRNAPPPADAAVLRPDFNFTAPFTGPLLSRRIHGILSSNAAASSCCCCCCCCHVCQHLQLLQRCAGSLFDRQAIIMLQAAQLLFHPQLPQLLHPRCCLLAVAVAAAQARSRRRDDA